MVRRGLMGAWMLVGALWLTQYGAVNAQENAPKLAAGPSQGAIPKAGQSPVTQQADTRQGGGGGAIDDSDQVDLDQRGDGGSRRADTREPAGLDHPLDSPGGGGGGGATLPRNVVPVMRGNPDGVDAVPEHPDVQQGGGGGGGGGTVTTGSGILITPYFMIIPDPDATPNVTPMSPQ